MGWVLGCVLVGCGGGAAADAGALVDEDSAPVLEHDAGDAGALVDEASPPAADAGDAGELVDAGACLVITGTVCAVGGGYVYLRVVRGPGGRVTAECCTTP